MTEQNKIKILCVEDEQEIRENIAEILRDEGFEVFEAENGRVGFDSFLQNKPDLVVSDIMMPEVDGYALLKAIREGKNVKNNLVPFIFLTALGQKDNVVKGVNLSANDYLVKPIDFDLMIAKIKEKTENFKYNCWKLY
jgi:DNA-binding response OmpR family regulator